MWERACSRWCRRGLPDKPRRLNREQARSHSVQCIAQPLFNAFACSSTASTWPGTFTPRHS
ncbi:hypothetical protein EU514_10025 [Pseudomonas fragi]|nr:hypothetical protein [Pseudomonas fragi]